jgi:probable phosphoglycerate mutase
MGDTTRLYLVRHGESNAMVDAVVGGHEGCTGLSDLGRRQAEALRDRLAASGEISADVLLASILPRAIETAEIIAPSLGGIDVDSHCDLCEQHPGECDGMSWEEAKNQHDTDSWSPYQPFSPGGEPWAEFMVRAGAALHRVAQEHEGRSIVVACHGGIVHASMVAGLGLPVTSIPPINVDNTSITEWEITDGRWRLFRFNDAAHLATL